MLYLSKHILSHIDLALSLVYKTGLECKVLTTEIATRVSLRDVRDNCKGRVKENFIKKNRKLVSTQVK